MPIGKRSGTCALFASFAVAVLGACNGGGGGGGGTGGDGLPPTYEYTSKFAGASGQSNVSYDGQVYRQLLIEEMVKYLEGLTAEVNGSFDPEIGDTYARLLAIYENTAAAGRLLPRSTSPASQQ